MAEQPFLVITIIQDNFPKVLIDSEFQTLGQCHRSYRMKSEPPGLALRSCVQDGKDQGSGAGGRHVCGLGAEEVCGVIRKVSSGRKWHKHPLIRVNTH